MGLPTWAKRKLEENWPASLSKAVMKVKNPGSRRITSSCTKSRAMKGNGIEGKTHQEGKSPNNSKARSSSPKEILLRRGLLLKQSNPSEMLVGSPKEHASTTTKWGITLKISPSPNQGMGALSL
jgi:hypothetical protein